MKSSWFPLEKPPRNNLNVPNFNIQNLQILFPDLFYWKMPPSRTSHPIAFSSNGLFQHSSTMTDIWHVYQLLAGCRHIRDNYATFVFLQQMIVWQEESERQQQQEQNKIGLLHKFADAAFEEACSNRLDTILLGDAPLCLMFPPIFLRHLCIFLLIVASPRWSSLVAPIPESNGHVM